MDKEGYELLVGVAALAVGVPAAFALLMVGVQKLFAPTE